MKHTLARAPATLVPASMAAHAGDLHRAASALGALFCLDPLLVSGWLREVADAPARSLDALSSAAGELADSAPEQPALPLPASVAVLARAWREPRRSLFVDVFCGLIRAKTARGGGTRSASSGSDGSGGSGGSDGSGGSGSSGGSGGSSGDGSGGSGGNNDAALAALAWCPLLRRGAELELSRWMCLLALEFCAACADTGARADWAWALRDALTRAPADDLRDAVAYAAAEGARCGLSGGRAGGGRTPVVYGDRAAVGGVGGGVGVGGGGGGVAVPRACTCAALCAADGLPAALGARRGELLACAQWALMSRLLPRLRPLPSAAPASAAAAAVPLLPPALADAPASAAAPRGKRTRARAARARAAGAEDSSGDDAEPRAPSALTLSL
jgi:hypothetical protein